MSSQKQNKKIQDAKFQAIYDEAHNAGISAVTEAIISNEIRPMVVQDGIQEYFVSDGVCGFAWINFAGNTAWGRFCKKMEYSRKDSYYGGQTIWVSYFSQSMQKKVKYAEAFTKVLNSHGIKAYSNSRMD